jgi:hypothetical protein
MTEAIEQQSKDDWHAPKLTVLGETGDLTKAGSGTTSDGTGSSTIVLSS